MIRAENASKRFGDICAVDSVSTQIKSASVFGLIGSNGAGKSTFMRMLAGILKPDSGRVLMDEIDIYENTACKARSFYISDEQYFIPNSTPDEMKLYYKQFYTGFDEKKYGELMHAFGLDTGLKIRTFSKGMKKQVSVILGLCSGAEYLYCDETFDGLDPVMRQAVKSLFAEGIEQRGMTPIVASHNLRELEDICDHIGLLHKGGILFSHDLDEMKLGIHKVQCVLQGENPLDALSGLEIIKAEQRGAVHTLTIRATREAIENCMAAVQPVFFEMIPLSLEEIFIRETEVLGYDVKKLLF